MRLERTLAEHALENGEDHSLEHRSEPAVLKLARFPPAVARLLAKDYLWLPRRYLGNVSAGRVSK